MAQHDYIIDNQTFPNTRADINSALAAVVSQNSGATAPSTTYAYQLWYDTATDKLKIRNANDDAWIEMFGFDQVGDTASITGNIDINITGIAVAGTLTDTSNTGNITLDFSAYQNFVLTLTGNITLDNPTTETLGQTGFLVLIQDATGSRTVSLGSQYLTAGAAGLTLSTAANAIDIVPYVVQATDKVLLGTPQLAFA
mgnify:CR=1 FL=1|tara:strand:+ start:1609 stop:2202 length:594 start_codon:yes stop_codon:yes gene_type:complete